MNIEKEKQKIALFSKVGIIVLSSFLLLAGGYYVLPKAISVTSTTNGKELPICCVDCKEKKVALSFDAAWGNGWVG
jgi:peptidoglycan-N-acetylglucosamine deacetylase